MMNLVKKYALAIVLIVVGIIAVYSERYLISGEDVFKLVFGVIAIMVTRFVLRPVEGNVKEAQA